MVVFILENVAPSLRGELTRWLIEPHPGVFVGHLTGMVRDKLWQKCCDKVKEGGALQLWSTNNEQRFDVRMFGKPGRTVRDFDGLKLIQIAHDAPDTPAADESPKSPMQREWID